MSWPLSQDYNEAIQDPRNSFSDADLKAGEAVTNALGIPLPHSGNFADVYEVRCPAGARWAVKCFTREVHGLRERYAEISKYLRKANLPFMVDFQYLEQGIRVRGQWYPVLKMQWVEGFVLNQFVRDNLDKKPILQAVGQIWLRMARRLRGAKLAHGDLQHGNVMFVPSGSANALAVKLIDYDGMCVPSLAGKNSGEVGHPAYQHPERLRTAAYNREMDRFSLLAIAAALRCLAVGGRSLWERYDNGDNLLFRQADLQAPKESPLFQELRAISDPQAQLLVNELYRACQGRLSAVPLVTDLVPEEKSASSSRSRITTKPQTTAAQEPDWDFSEKEGDASIVRNRRASGKMPVWVWGAVGGAAAVLLLGVGVGFGLALRNGPADNAAAPTTQNQHAAVVPKEEPKTPTEEPKIPSHENAKPPANPPEAVKPPADLPSVVDPPVESASPKRIFLLSPDGSSMAISNNGERTWRLVNPSTMAVIRQFPGHEGAVTSVAFSADGRRAVTSGDDGMLRLWDLQTGQMIGTRKVHNRPVISLALSPNGIKAAHANGGIDFEVWDFETNKGGGYHNSQKVTSVAFSPDGRYLVCGYEQSVKPTYSVLFLWPQAEGVKAQGFRGSLKAVSCLAVSPDGKYIAAGHAGDTGMVSLWEAATGRLVRQHTMTPLREEPKKPIHQVAFSPDGRLFLASMGNQYFAWPVEPGPNNPFTGTGNGNFKEDLITAAFTPDSGGVTFTFRKDDQPTAAQTVRFQKLPVASNPPPAVAVKPPPRPRRVSNKLSVPSEQVLDDKRKLLQVTYRDDYKNKPKRALASQMFEDSRRQGDAALSYVMLNEACDLASRDGDLATALRAASELLARFDVDPLEAKCRVLEQTLPTVPVKDKSTFRLLAQKALLFLDRAVIDEQFDYGDRLLEVAKAAAAKADMSAALVKIVNQETKEFKAIREEFDAIKRHADKLETAPDDAEANLAVGRFRCFNRGDWDGGLPLLVKGNDKALSELAQNDLADPGDPGARAALGDAWSQRADKMTGKEQEACRRRAHYWYQDCFDDLEKKEQTRVKGRINKLLTQLPELRKPFHDLDIGTAAINRKTGVPMLRLLPQQHIATRQLYHGPIEIRITALLPKNSIRITFLNGGEWVLRPENQSTKASFYIPFNNDPDGQGFGPNTDFVSLKPGVLNDIRIQVTANGWSIRLNGRFVRGQSGFRAFSFAPTPVRVWSDDGEVDIASMVVKRIR